MQDKNLERIAAIEMPALIAFDPVKGGKISRFE